MASISNQAAHVSVAFMAYMNQHVFTPAGIATVTLKPVGADRTLGYPFPAGNVHGTDFGDGTDIGGGGGYQLSSDELAALLRRRTDGTLLPSASVRNMDRYLLCWQGTTPVRHGSVFWHGGGFPIAQNPGALSTIVISFTTGVHVGLEINPETEVGLLDAVLDAYDGSWVVLR